MGNDLKPDLHHEHHLDNDHSLSPSLLDNLGELPPPVLSHLAKHRNLYPDPRTLRNLTLTHQGRTLQNYKK